MLAEHVALFDEYDSWHMCLWHRGDFVLAEHVALFDVYDSWRMCLWHRGDFVLAEHVALFDEYDSWRMKEYAAFRRLRLVRHTQTASFIAVMFHRLTLISLPLLSDILVPSTRRASIGDRAFAVAGPRAWHSLPPALRSTSTSFITFKKNLNHFCLDCHSVCDNVYCLLTMFSALAAVCTVYCAIEIVLITLHYISLLIMDEALPYF